MENMLDLSIEEIQGAQRTKNATSLPKEALMGAKVKFLRPFAYEEADGKETEPIDKSLLYEVTDYETGNAGTMKGEIIRISVKALLFTKRALKTEEVNNPESLGTVASQLLLAINNPDVADDDASTKIPTTFTIRGVANSKEDKTKAGETAPLTRYPAGLFKAFNIRADELGATESIMSLYRDRKLMNSLKISGLEADLLAEHTTDPAAFADKYATKTLVIS